MLYAEREKTYFFLLILFFGIKAKEKAVDRQLLTHFLLKLFFTDRTAIYDEADDQTTLVLTKNLSVYLHAQWKEQSSNKESIKIYVFLFNRRVQDKTKSMST